MPVSDPALPLATAGARTRWQRLRQRAQFDAVLSTPPVAKTQHFALHAVTPTSAMITAGLFTGAGPWIGVLLPKRWAKRAVTRNTFRRQIYALSQASASAWAGQVVVVRLRHAFSPQQFTSATSDTLKRAARTELLRLFPEVGHA